MHSEPEPEPRRAGEHGLDRQRTPIYSSTVCVYTRAGVLTEARLCCVDGEGGTCRDGEAPRLRAARADTHGDG